MDNSLIHADIFFFITSIAVVLLAVGLIVVIAYVIKILRDFREISQIVKNETRLVAGDIDELRQNVKEGVAGWSGLWSIFSNTYRRNKKGRQSRKAN